MPYTMDYSGTEPEQRNLAPREAQTVHAAPPYPTRRRFEVPSIVKTGATFAFAAGLFFSAEALAPPELRPSTWTGTYNARVEAAVKASELNQQAKLSVEQQAEQYKALNQGFLAEYQATLDRGKILATATAEIQKQYVGYRMAQTQATQSTDIAISNWTRLWGRFANAMEPGAGDSALAYSQRLGDELSGELTSAAKNGQTISVEGWDTGLASVADLRRQIANLKPITIPPPPRLGEEPTSLSPVRTAR